MPGEPEQAAQEYYHQRTHQTVVACLAQTISSMQAITAEGIPHTGKFTLPVSGQFILALWLKTLRIKPEAPPIGEHQKELMPQRIKTQYAFL